MEISLKDFLYKWAEDFENSRYMNSTGSNIPKKWVDEITTDTKQKPDGGPAEYYDLPKGSSTLNDLIEYKGDTSWLGDTFHLGNIVKAAWRWGTKDGTSKEYDARKFIYTGCRLLKKYAGVTSVIDTLKEILNDPQFKEKE